MKFTVPLALYDVLVSIDFSELSSAPEIVALSDRIERAIASEEVSLAQIILTEDIVARGMDNQNTVNDLGKQLYWLYDELLWQI